MRRAIVISLVVHVLVLLGMFELRLLPAYAPSATQGRGPLSVDFAALKMPEGVVSERRDDASGIAPERHSGKPVLSTAGSERRPSGRPAQTAPQLERRPSPAPPESMPGLPAELESAYRLNIARELRRAGGLPQAWEALGRPGSVALVISYWDGLYAPVVSIARSSGHAELDEMAVTSLSAAVASVQLPAAARFRMPYVVESYPAR